MITPALAEVEELIVSRLASDATLLTEISRYLLSLGGKRVRPLLAILCAKLFGMREPFSSSEAGQRLLEVSAGIELIHMGTLLHDDIIDKSPLRRNRESAYVKYGAENTLITGDFLLSRAFGLCSRLDRVIIEETEEACVALTEGEILETSLVQEPHTVQSSLNIARKKTAALFRLAALSGAHLAGVREMTRLHLAEFGEKLGVAFQILDDILDVTADQDLLGKRTGQDLRERKPSIVNVLWLESGSTLAQQLRQSSSGAEEAFVLEALAELRGGTIIVQARVLATSYAEEAQEALNRALAGEDKVVQQVYDQVRALIEFVLERVK